MPRTRKTKAPCAGAASHRKAQAKYVGKNRAKHNASVKSSYQKNKGKILAKKKAAGGSKKKAGGGGGKTGRPRKC